MERTTDKQSYLRGLFLAAAVAGLSACGGGGGGGGGGGDGGNPPGGNNPDPGGEKPSITLKRSVFEHLNPGSSELVTTTGSVSGIEKATSLTVSEDFATLQLAGGKPASKISVKDGDKFTLNINPEKTFDGVFNNQASVKLVLGDKAATQTVKLDSLDNQAPVTYLDFPPKNGVTDASTMTLIADGQDNDPASLSMHVNGVAIEPSTLEDGRSSTTFDLGGGVNTISVSFKDGNNNTNTVESVIFRATELVSNPRDIVWSEQDQLAYVLADSDIAGNDELVIWAVDLDNETSRKVTGDGIGEGIPLPACNGTDSCEGIIDIALDQQNGRNQIIAVGQIQSVGGETHGIGMAIDLATGNRSDLISAPIDIGSLVKPMAVAVMNDDRVAVIDDRSGVNADTMLLLAPLTGNTPGKATESVSLGDETGSATELRAAFDAVNNRIVMASDDGGTDAHFLFYDLATKELTTSVQPVFNTAGARKIRDFKMHEDASENEGVVFYVTARNMDLGFTNVSRIVLDADGEPQQVGSIIAGDPSLTAVIVRELAAGADAGKLEVIAVNRSDVETMHRKLHESFTGSFDTLVPDPAKTEGYKQIADLGFAVVGAGLVLDSPRNRLLLGSNAPGGPSGTSRIDAIDLATGQTSAFVDSADLLESLKPYFVIDMALDVTNNRVVALVDDGRGETTRDDSSHPNAGLFAFDLDTGARTVIKLTDAFNGVTESFKKPYAIAIHDGVIYVAEENADTARVLAYITGNEAPVLIGEETGSNLGAPVSLAMVEDADGKATLFGLDDDGMIFRVVTLDASNTAISNESTPSLNAQSLTSDGTRLWISYRTALGETGVAKIDPDTLTVEIASGQAGDQAIGYGPVIAEPAPTGLAVDPMTRVAYVFDTAFGAKQIVSVLLAKRVNDDQTTSFIGDRVKISGD